MRLRCCVIWLAFFLFSIGGAPVAADRQCGHALKIKVRQHFGVNQGGDFLDVTVTDAMILLDDFQDLFRNALDQGVRCFGGSDVECQQAGRTENKKTRDHFGGAFSHRNGVGGRRRSGSGGVAGRRHERRRIRRWPPLR